jgi:threonine/homoserine/homoserine lactone efflux protein
VAGAVERTHGVGPPPAVCFTPLARTLGDSRLAHLLGYVGAIVLFALAARVAHSAMRTENRPGAREPGARSASARAFMTTIVNPKALAVYLVVVPGVAVSLGQSLRSIGVAFAVTHIVCTFGWLTAVDAAIQRARWLGQPRSRRMLKLAATTGLIVTGVILLLTGRA